jgi:hypothetical protein
VVDRENKADLEAQEQAKRVHLVEVEKERLRASWVASGCDPAKFEQEYPALRNGIRGKALLERDEAIRRQAVQWLVGRS